MSKRYDVPLDTFRSPIMGISPESTEEVPAGLQGPMVDMQEYTVRRTNETFLGTTKGPPMEIQTVAQAQEAIRAVVTWLGTYREPLTRDDLRRDQHDLTDEAFAADYPIISYDVGREASGTLARWWSKDLLNASTAADLEGNCLLCGS